MRPVVRDLLLAACGAPGSVRRHGALGTEDWRAAMTAADVAGLAGPLHAYVEGLPASARPGPHVLDALRSLYYRQAARNADLLATLGEVLQALAARGIPVVVLKGAALLESVYRNLAVRSMRDLDLLFRRGDLDAAVTVVEELGFAPDEWFRPAAWYVEHLHHLVPYARGDITVELHHHVVPPWVDLAVSADELWERSISTVIVGAPARVLAPDDCLLHIAVHVAAAHRFVNGLDGLRDLAELQRRPETGIDWARMARSARGQERAVWAALAMTHLLLGGEPPAAAREALASGRLTRLETRLLGGLTRGVVFRSRSGDAAAVPTWFLQSCIVQVLTRRGWGARSWAVLREILSMWTRGPLTPARPSGAGTALSHPWRTLRRRMMDHP